LHALGTIATAFGSSGGYCILLCWMAAALLIIESSMLPLKVLCKCAIVLFKSVEVSWLPGAQVVKAGALL